jgi:integrase
MSATSAATPAALSRLPTSLDHEAWVAFLGQSLLPAGQWRPGEFDPSRCLFTGDPDNPMTTTVRCRMTGCGRLVDSRCLCSPCRRALRTSGLDEDEFIQREVLALARRALTGERCVVRRDGVCCERRRRSNQTGLCHGHTTQWNRRGRYLGLTLEQWCAEMARPLPARAGCSVTGCTADAKLDVPLCGVHHRAWRDSEAEVRSGRRQGAEEWAARQPPVLARNQFSLATLSPTVRVELLYALQQRDRQGQKLDPTAVRRLIGALEGAEALALIAGEDLCQRFPKDRRVVAYARLIGRIVALKFQAFFGVIHTSTDVWEALALDLEEPRPGRRPNRAVVDFTPITQEWLREATKHWVVTVRPATGNVRRALQAATLASAALARRPGGGHDPAGLGFAEVTAAFDAIKGATRADGRRYDSHFRRGLWARFWAVIELGRASGLLDELPGTFTRSRSQRIVATEVNEDQIGKAVPEMVIAQLDAQLGLLGTDRTYGRLWSSSDTQALFQAAYVVLRDTGRRPGEVVALSVDCVEVDGEDYALVYDNHKSRRLRRRLPVTVATAAAIEDWRGRRDGLLLPACAEGFLFPACNESSGPGHLTTIRLAQALRAWVDRIPALCSHVPGPDGTPLAFDRRAIYPYAFRHSYAQRHADAGVGVEVLKELMDHRDLSVTQGYYTVSLKRKRQAITIMSSYVHDRTGMPRPGPAQDGATSYELRSVAVPFGNCIEPSNVKAGGKACPIRFQCAGCGFYRPDPSYLPAIEEHVNALRADKETAVAMEADEFVVRNLDDQAAAFGQVTHAMRDRLAELPDDERAEVEAASTLLRKLRAGRAPEGRRLIPLTVEHTP